MDVDIFIVETRASFSEMYSKMRVHAAFTDPVGDTYRYCLICLDGTNYH